MNEYTTKDKDVLRGISRRPLELSRLSDEDLVNLNQFISKKQTDSSESGSTSGPSTDVPERAESVTGIPQVEMTEELEENIRHRGRAYMSFKSSLIAKKSEDDDSDEMLSAGKERSTSLYQRSSDCEVVNLEEF